MPMKRLFGALLLAAVPLLARGQDYPNRPVHMIIPFAPGGASDFVGRIIQPGLEQALGQPIVVDNRPGASGNIGMAAAAHAAPDGYTVYLGNVGTIAINPGVFTRLEVRPTKDFIAITQVVDVPGVLIANPSFPPSSVQQLVAYVKAHPGAVNYASPGSGSQNRLEMEKLRNAAGLDMVHVPYKGGAGPAVTGLVTGETQVMFVTASSAMPMIKAGRLKVLAVTAPKRLAPLPDAPTMREAGFPAFESGSWQGLFVPAGTPRAIVDRLYDVAVGVMRSPEVIERLSHGGVEAVTSRSPQAFAEFVADETERWGRAAKEAGATVD
jgi:tripartite-type tricarboxylate transporter receptor subunit TctC